MGWLDFFRRKKAPRPTLKEIWSGFQDVLAANNEALALMGDLEEKVSSPQGCDFPYLRLIVKTLDQHFADLVAALQQISGGRFVELDEARRRIRAVIHQRLDQSDEPRSFPPAPLVVPLADAPPSQWSALGGKAGNLARVKKQLGLPVPEGAVATLSAYKLFMEQGEPDRGGTLLDRLRAKLSALDLGNPAAVAKAAQELQTLVLAAPIPGELAQALQTAAVRLAAGGTHSLIVRSSGGREDLAATFAGQYDSFLGVAPEEVPRRWLQVVASQFGERPLIYFKLQGLLLEEAAMGVLIQRLIEPRAAGVMFTTDPEGGDPDRLVINATWGLAVDLVAGRVSADEYLVSKEQGRLLEARYGPKEYCLAVRQGFLEKRAVPPELVTAPALTEADLECLAGFARALEQHFGYPQSVEWVKDDQERLFIVQSRHLPQVDLRERGAIPSPQAPVDAPVLLESGQVGAPGVAAGAVFHLPEGGSPAEVPDGAVLVAPRATPQLAPALPRVAAMVADSGSPTGHLALVAREYGIPLLVNTVHGSQMLPAGEVVTVDACQGRVYQGRVAELLTREAPGAAPHPESPFSPRLRGVADLILPLNLVDRRSPEFRPENCRTYHDVARFAHEKAIQVMIGLMDEVAAGRVPALRLLKLKTDLPLNLHLVDLGEGLASHETPVPPEDITSRPMRALWRGISRPDIAWAGPVPVNLGGFLQVLGQSAIRPPEKFWDKTYAIVAANYVNYACRLGYHFQSVDSYLGEVAADNFINFVFKGGAADDTRRIRRIRLIATVLEHLGFKMEIRGDVIRARFRNRSAPETEERLDLLGRLMAYVRQMDMLMSDDTISQTLAERFLAGHYERPGQEGAGETE